MINDYYRAKSKDDAWNHIQNGAKILGGGNQISRNQENVDEVVDLQELELNEIKVHDGSLIIGANVKLQHISENLKIWDSLKKVIVQEFNLNTRNSASIAGAAISGSGRSNLTGWLICSDAKFHLYPSSLIYKTEALRNINYQNEGFIDHISIALDNQILWRMVSRTPDDFPLVSVFIKRNNEKKIVNTVLVGFGEKPLILKEELESKNASETLIKLINNARSQYTNKFCSIDYYKNSAALLLNRILVEE